MLDLSEENGEPPNQLSKQTQTSIADTPASELVDKTVETTNDAQLVASSSKAKYRLWLLTLFINACKLYNTGYEKFGICCMFGVLKDLSIVMNL